MHLTSQATRTKTTKKCGNMIEKNFLQVVVTCFTIRNIGIVEQGKGFMMNWLSILSSVYYFILFVVNHLRHRIAWNKNSITKMRNGTTAVSMFICIYLVLLSLVKLSQPYYIYNFAGNGTSGDTGDGGPALNALLYNPFGISLSEKDDLYVADVHNNRVRVIYANGTIDAFAGNGTLGNIGDGGPAKDAELNCVSGVLIAPSGEVFIGDTCNEVVRIVYTNGTIQKIAGPQDLCSPNGFSIDANGTIYFVSNCYYQVWSFTVTNFTLNLIAGNGTPGYTGDGGPATNATLNFPSDTSVSLTGDIYIADSSNNAIRVVYTNGIIDTFVTGLSNPKGVAVSFIDEVYVADTDNNVVKLVYPNRTIDVIAGSGAPNFSGNGILANEAQLGHPRGLALGANGEIYVSAGQNNAIRILVKSPSSDCFNNGYYQSNSYCICADGYTGDNCEYAICYGINGSSYDVCSGNGSCVSPDNCQCHSGYGGYNCDMLMCYGVNITAQNVCSGHGTCESANNCSCNAGYTGNNCEFALCYGVNQSNVSVCSGNGNCSSPDNCVCDTGYTGYNCEYGICFGVNGSLTSACNGYGICLGYNDCSCYGGFTGSNCSEITSEFLNVTVIGSPNSYTCSAFYFDAIIEQASHAQVLSITWILQGGYSKAIYPSNSTTFMIPAVNLTSSAAYNITAIVSAGMIGTNETLLISQSTYPFIASCNGACFGYVIGCRYSVNIDSVNGVYKTNSSFSVNRVNRFWLTAMVRDNLFNSDTYTGFSFLWSYSILNPSNTRRSRYLTLQDVNALLLSTENTPSFIIAPLTADGIAPNIQFDINLKIVVSTPTLQTEITINFNIITSPLNEIPPPSKDALVITPTEGYSLVDTFYMVAENWPNAFAYEFSFLEQSSGNYIPLYEGYDPFFSTTLPSGAAPSSNLTIKVKVITDVGNVGTYQQTIVVKPYIEKGLLTNKTNEMIESGNYTLAISIANQIKNAPEDQIQSNIQEVKQVISTLLAYTLSVVNNIEPLNMSQTLATQQLVVVEMLTTNGQIISSQNKMDSLTISLNLIYIAEFNMSRTVLQEYSLQRITNIISNVAIGNSYSDVYISNQTIATSNKLAEFQLKQQILGQIPTSFVSDNFKFSVMYSTTISMLETDIMVSPNSNNTIYIPAQFNMDISEQILSYTILVFTQNIYQWDKINNVRYTATPVLDLTFKSQNSMTVQVANLTEPILIHLKRNENPCTGEKLDCRYWSEEHLEWKSDGCILVDTNNTDNSITCACNHTTSFSAFILEKGDCGTQIGLDVTGIVFNSIHIAICLPIFIGLFFLRNHLPLKSRFVAPYFGIASILVDAFLQGWIRNALSLADEYNAADAFSFLIMLTSNPLTIATLFVFLWQHIRFILMQNIYYLMPNVKGKMRKRIMKICRILTSKLVYSLTIAVILLGVMFYFAILVGLAAHYSKISINDRNDLTATLSVSMGIMMLIFSIGIILSVTLDVILSIKKKSVINQNDKGMQEMQVITQARGIGFVIRLFTENDPLYFRTESVLILLTAFMTVILYSIGIASVIEQAPAMSPIVIVRTVIEIIVMLMEIVAFGGFIFGVTLKRYISLKRGNYSVHENSDEQKNDKPIEDELLEMIRNNLGYQFVYQYCQMEFSLENLLLWKELEDLRPRNLIMSTEERKQALDEINELYIRNNSERQLNIANKDKKKFLAILEISTITASDAEEAFQLLYDVCLLNLSDTIVRLRSSELYQDYCRITETHQQLKLTF